jgi:hypothetical protein
MKGISIFGKRINLRIGYVTWLIPIISLHQFYDIFADCPSTGCLANKVKTFIEKVKFIENSLKADNGNFDDVDLEQIMSLKNILELKFLLRNKNPIINILMIFISYTVDQLLIH